MQMILHSIVVPAKANKQQKNMYSVPHKLHFFYGFHLVLNAGINISHNLTKAGNNGW